MVSSALLLLTTAFASYASAAPKPKRVLLGFRTVCQAEAEAINSLGSIYWDPGHSAANWPGQLGLGKSHSNVAGLWSGFIAGNAALGGDWFCYTTADPSKINRATKIWINPIDEPAPGQAFYPYNEDTIQEILRAAGAPKPEKALRLGRVGDGEELLIPAAALPGPDVDDGGTLKLKTFCFGTLEEMYADMPGNGVTETTANYDSAIFTTKGYTVTDQKKKRAAMDEGEGEVVAGPARLLRFMPRDLKNLKTTTSSGKQGTTTPKGSGKQGTTTPKGSEKQGIAASGSSSSSSSSNTLVLAKGYTITLRKDPKAKKFPVPKADGCPTGLTFGKKPKVVASTGSKKPDSGGKKPNSGGKKPNSGGK